MKKIVVFLLILVLFIFIFLLNGEKIFLNLGKGLQKFLYTHSIPKRNVCNDIEKIKLSAFKRENELLRKHLNFLENSKDNFVMANVTGKTQENSLSWYILDKGSKQGIKKGLAVTDENGAFVGTIAKVKTNTSTFKPLIDQGSRISADVKASNQIVSGIVQGEFGSTVKMKYVPIDISISKGDYVITSGLDENIRRGIALGKVKKVQKQENDIFQEIIMDPLFDPNFRIVSIIIPE